MKKSEIKKLQSIKNFRLNINRTFKLINGLMANIVATEALNDLLFTKRKRKLTSKDKKMLKILEIGKKDKNYLFTIGFIALFSNFEFFMFDFLKELFIKFPKSLPDEKIVKIKEISRLSSVKKIKEYFADSIAIEKSYEIQKWAEFVKSKFGIKVFKKKDLVRIQLLNELRNAFMHSGGKTSSKFRTKVMAILKTDIPLNEEIPFDMKKWFKRAFSYFHHLLGNF